MIGLALQPARRYGLPVAVNPAAGFGDPNTTRRTSAHHSIAGAFFVPAMPCYGGCAWETLGSAGFRVSRFANLRTAATLTRLATIRGSSDNTHGATPMHPVRNLSASHADAWKARALSALRSNSSLSVRLARYNEAMAKARALESQEVRHA